MTSYCNFAYCLYHFVKHCILSVLFHISVYSLYFYVSQKNNKKKKKKVICHDNKTKTQKKGSNFQNTMAVHNHTNINSETIAASVKKGPGGNNECKSIKRMPSIDTEIENNHCDTTTGCQKLIFDIKNTESDKFMISIIYDDQNKIPTPV